MKFLAAFLLVTTMTYNYAHAEEQCICPPNYRVWIVDSKPMCMRPALISKNAVCYQGSTIQIDAKGREDRCPNPGGKTMPEGLPLSDFPFSYLTKWNLSARIGLDIWSKTEMTFKECAAIGF